MVLCPDCRVVSPNVVVEVEEEEDYGYDRKMAPFPKLNHHHGVGMGVKI